ncbi:hypothetical protein H8E88_12780 [candidate division KSB1 bacterium]|nr:hypothetical protein [candidate division KSB1 bacterium]MBL7094857.1 hypothetical protein [candidate division KSB1 bacterium]
MSAKIDYNNSELVNSACENILNFIQPGDVVTSVGTHKWWQFWSAIIHYGIQLQHRRFFGGNSNWRSTHAMLYLDKKNTFSVEMPRAIFKPLKEYCLSEMFIYRLQLKELTSEDIESLKKAATELAGENYDIGQIVDIALNSLLGYGHQRRYKLFDLGRKKKVCSVGVRAAFEYLYLKNIKTEESRPGKWLFYEMNPQKWSQKKIEKYNGTDVEVTTPAHFCNSDYFCDDFELVAQFKNGVQVTEFNEYILLKEEADIYKAVEKSKQEIENGNYLTHKELNSSINNLLK